MATLCPNGHESTTDDYCDSCGVRMSAPGSEHESLEAPSMAVVPPVPPAAAAVEPEPCPRCNALRVDDDPFCESCGHQFGVELVTVAWEAVITADRQQYDRAASAEVEFPADQMCRVVQLTEPEILIGRRRESRGAHPQIDCCGPPEDPAVSHRHARLVRDDDGGYSVCDLGSTNGTTINDDPNPIVENALVALKDGDRVHVGAWTTVTFRVSPPR